jgi:hypothetical protein
MFDVKDKRYAKFYRETINIVWDEDAFNFYYKEKYWRFDVEYRWDKPWVQDKLFDMEIESENCCQRCAKHRYQKWTNWWRIEHWCIPCYIYMLFNRIIKKLKV